MRCGNDRGRRLGSNSPSIRRGKGGGKVGWRKYSLFPRQGGMSCEQHTRCSNVTFAAECRAYPTFRRGQSALAGQNFRRHGWTSRKAVFGLRRTSNGRLTPGNRRQPVNSRRRHGNASRIGDVGYKVSWRWTDNEATKPATPTSNSKSIERNIKSHPSIKQSPSLLQPISIASSTKPFFTTRQRHVSNEREKSHKCGVL